MCIKLLQTYTCCDILILWKIIIDIQNKKRINRFRHEPNAIVNSFNGMICSKSLNEAD